jgi:hypothetical protein
VLVSFARSPSAEEDPISLIFVPILAQALSFGTGARSEVRYVVTKERDKPVAEHFELGSGAALGLYFSSEHFSLGAGYGPSLTIKPLFSSPRETELTHTAFASAGAGYELKFRRLTITLGQSANYALYNTTAIAIAGPTALPLPTPETPRPSEEQPPEGGTGTEQQPQPTAPEGQGPGNAGQGGLNPDGTPNTGRGTNRELLHTGGLTTSIEFKHAISNKTTLSERLEYVLSIGLGERSRDDYPLVQGIKGHVSYSQRLTARDSLTAALDTGHAWSELDSDGQVATLTTTWGHLFTRQLESYLTGGVAYTRTRVGDQAVPNSIYPTGGAGINYHTRVAGGDFNFNANFYAAPVLDFTYARVDPQLGYSMGAGWGRDRTTLSASFGSAISVTRAGEDDPVGALNNFYASAGAGYEIGAGFHAETGVRAAWLEYSDFQSVPPQLAIYVGVSWGAGADLMQARGAGALRR